MGRTLFYASLIVFAALFRFLPHPPNVAPIAAIALFGAAYFERRFAFILPLGALFLSDLLLGFYDGMAWVYGSFILVGLVGFWLRSHKGLLPTAGAAIAGSIVFYVITNFGVWISGSLYPRTLVGLVECYVAALPFFRNTLLGDTAYVALLFGVTELASRRVSFLKAPTRETVR